MREQVSNEEKPCVCDPDDWVLGREIVCDDYSPLSDMTCMNCLHDKGCHDAPLIPHHQTSPKRYSLSAEAPPAEGGTAQPRSTPLGKPAMKSLGHKRGGGSINLRGKRERRLSCGCCTLVNRKEQFAKRDFVRSLAHLTDSQRNLSFGNKRV